LDGRRPLPEQPRTDRRRDRGHRPHPDQLCPDHPDGRLHRQGDRAPDGIRTRMNENDDAPAAPGDADAAANNNFAEAPPSAEEGVAALEAELAEHKDRLLRALAETENTRRRAQREREDAAKYAVSGFARDLLPAADNLRRALDSLPETKAADNLT